MSETMPRAITKPNPSARSLRIPARDDEAADALDHVRDRVERRRDPEPLDPDEIPWGVHRRDEEEDEEDRRSALDRLARARPEREPRAESAERQRDRPVDEEHEDPGESRLEPHPGREADGDVEEHLDHSEDDDAGELSGEERPIAQSRQREAVDEPRLHVARRSVPAFIVEKSAPWMNGTASAKARNDVVGKPGRSVDERRRRSRP